MLAPTPTVIVAPLQIRLLSQIGTIEIAMQWSAWADADGVGHPRFQLMLAQPGPDKRSALHRKFEPRLLGVVPRYLPAPHCGVRHAAERARSGATISGHSQRPATERLGICGDGLLDPQDSWGPRGRRWRRLQIVRYDAATHWRTLS